MIVKQQHILRTLFLRAVNHGGPLAVWEEGE